MAEPGQLLARGLGRAGPGDAEVGQPGVALPQEDVLRLDVAVDHVAAVGVLQGVGDAAGDADGVAHREPAFAAEAVAEGAGLDVGHDVPEVAFILARVVDRQDVGMVEPGGELDLAVEALGGERGGELGGPAA